MAVRKLWQVCDFCSLQPLEERWYHLEVSWQTNIRLHYKFNQNLHWSIFGVPISKPVIWHDLIIISNCYLLLLFFIFHFFFILQGYKMVTSFLTPAKLSCYSCCLVFLGSAVHFTHIKWYYSFTVLFLYSTFDYNYVLICEVIFNESDCQSILYSFHCIFCTGVCKRLSLLHTCFH